MPPLHPDLRRSLERAVVAARDAAEKAASVALTSLAVGQPEAYGGMRESDKDLRVRLRREARRLGDELERKPSDPFPALTAECAYEQWHRLVFARFLAENDLLMHPTGGSVTLQDCAALAADEGEPDAWMVAAKYAAEMLPGIFRNGDPVLQVRLAPEGRQALEKLVGDLPPQVFHADDSLGWSYQFWQTKKKAEVNKSGRKIQGADLPPVTQLFTEHYMVEFLLHNTLGAWWVSRHVGSPQSDAEKTNLTTENAEERRGEAGLAQGSGDAEETRLTTENAEERRGKRDEQTSQYRGCGSPAPADPSSTSLRSSAFSAVKNDLLTSDRDAGESVISPSTVESVLSASEISAVRSQFPYLRFKDDGSPAAGCFPGWPDRAADLKVMDPCCGSVHFLLVAFELLRTMRMEEEGLPEADAGDAVLRDNLFGLEIDARCIQIGAFALALAAWKSGGYRELPLPNLACSGLPVGDRLYEWTALAKGDPELEDTLRSLYHLFRDAPSLGSLIDPASVISEPASGPRLPVFTQDWDKVSRLLDWALAKERSQEDPVAGVFGVAARGLARAADLLAGKYHLVATNVPYLSGGKQGEVLRVFIEKHHCSAKADLATAFVERCLAFCAEGGTAALVTPQNWLFLGSYEAMRKKLLRETTWNVVVRI